MCALKSWLGRYGVVVLGKPIGPQDELADAIRADWLSSGA